LSLEDEIAAAIHGHERWKARLGTSIDQGGATADVADVGKDNLCAFGRWLYGSTIPKAALYDPNYIIVQFLHAKFHECARQVVQLLADGRPAEARAMLDHGEYAKISGQLTATMLKWRDSVRKNSAGPRRRNGRP
jgi:Chemoreceptor zinc-binding domain